MAVLKIKVSVQYDEQRPVEKAKEYPAPDFEQANRAIPFASKELLGQSVLEVLYAAGVVPKPQPGGEDKDVR